MQWESTPALYFMKARYYKPSIGTFVSMDPLQIRGGEPQSLHRYLYGRNTPSINIDPTGTLSCREMCYLKFTTLVALILLGYTACLAVCVGSLLFVILCAALCTWTYAVLTTAATAFLEDCLKTCPCGET